MEFQTFSTTLHLIGLALGAGGACLSGVLFFYSIADREITKVELKLMEWGNAVVWLGLALLVISGSGIFASNIEGYLHDNKFHIKMMILAALVINELIFKFGHLLRIKRHAGQHYPSSDEFVRKAPWLLLSGAVTFVSWAALIAMGTVKALQFSLLDTVFMYVIAVLLSFVAGMAVKNRIFFSE